MMPTVSLTMIVRNEEKNLAYCLNSVKTAVDEIVIVDTGSTDQTISIAERYTDKVYHYLWQDDFSAARNFAISKSSGQWILVMDADEFLELGAGGLQTVIGADSFTETIFLPLRCLHDDMDPQCYNHYLVLRLFRNLPEYRFAGAIHEQVIITCPEKVRIAHEPVLWHKSQIGKGRNKKRKRNLDLLKTACRAEPDNYFLQYYQGVEWLGLGKFARAVKLFEAACSKLLPEEVLFRAPAVGGLILGLRHQGKLDEAFSVCSGECEVYPDYTDLYFDAGTILEEQGKFHQAIGWFNGAINKGKPPPEFNHTSGTESFLAYQHLGRCYEAVGNPRQAEAYYRQAFCANNEYIGSLYQLFFLKLSQIGTEQLLLYFRELGCFEKEHCVKFLGLLFLEAGLPDLAAVCYEAAAEQDDLTNWCRSLVLGGELSKAIAVINTARLNNEALPYTAEVCEIVAAALSGEYRRAKDLALAMWRQPQKRSGALALLMVLANFEAGNSGIKPEKTREPEVVQTLIDILDSCLRFRGRKKPENWQLAARYVELANKTLHCLTALTAESNKVLIAYLQAKTQAIYKVLDYKSLAARCLYHG
ncbi:MAG: glycosyl transferase family 2 [Firmicutes bacterium]|nr:glycosyl transferase family 2 [Bacillota bacterium]